MFSEYAVFLTIVFLNTFLTVSTADNAIGSIVVLGAMKEIRHDKRLKG